MPRIRQLRRSESLHSSGDACTIATSIGPSQPHRLYLRPKFKGLQTPSVASPSSLCFIPTRNPQVPASPVRTHHASHHRTSRSSPRNARRSTGPRTPEGKARSSRNAVKLGLFTAHDFILPEDEEAYNALRDAFWRELQPEGPLEETYAMEAIRSSWRLQRCAKAEWNRVEQFIREAEKGTPVYDPRIMDFKPDRVPYKPVDQLGYKMGSCFQDSIDRARAQATNALRRAVAELRRLQNEREIARQTEAPVRGVAESPAVAKGVADVRKTTPAAPTTQVVKRTAAAGSNAGKVISSPEADFAERAAAIMTAIPPALDQAIAKRSAAA